VKEIRLSPAARGMASHTYVYMHAYGGCAHRGRQRQQLDLDRQREELEFKKMVRAGQRSGCICTAAVLTGNCSCEHACS
jgi:serine protease inhibitor ecotin